MRILENGWVIWEDRIRNEYLRGSLGSCINFRGNEKQRIGLDGLVMLRREPSWVGLKINEEGEEDRRKYG